MSFMKRIIFTLLLAAGFNADAGILIQVEPYGHDVNGYPVYSTMGWGGGDVYNSNGQYLGHLTGQIFKEGWLVRSPSGKIFKIYSNLYWR
jgi:hypothetical protein